MILGFNPAVKIATNFKFFCGRTISHLYFVFHFCGLHLYKIKGDPCHSQWGLQSELRGLLNARPEQQNKTSERCQEQWLSYTSYCTLLLFTFYYGYHTRNFGYNLYWVYIAKSRYFHICFSPAFYVTKYSSSCFMFYLRICEKHCLKRMSTHVQGLVVDIIGT